MTASRELWLTAVPFGEEARVDDEVDGAPVWEKFVRGAFIAARPERVLLRYEHRQPVGVVLALREREHALTARVRLSGGPLGDTLLEAAEHGELKVSAGFAPRLHHYERGEAGAVKVRTLVRLEELSLTYSPVYQNTQVRTAVRVEQDRIRAWLWLNQQRRAAGKDPLPLPTRAARTRPVDTSDRVSGRSGPGGLRYTTGGRVLAIR